MERISSRLISGWSLFAYKKQVEQPVIKLKTFKKSLGKSAETMSEKQILELRDHQEKTAEIFFGLWQKDTEKKKQKKVIIKTMT